MTEKAWPNISITILFSRPFSISSCFFLVFSFLSLSPFCFFAPFNYSSAPPTNYPRPRPSLLLLVRLFGQNALIPQPYLCTIDRALVPGIAHNLTSPTPRGIHAHFIFTLPSSYQKPKGQSIRMALAMAMNPVWVEITDPESRNTFYANLVNEVDIWMQCTFLARTHTYSSYLPHLPFVVLLR